MARTVKMTEGNIPAQLAVYAMPLILGNLFQLTYNVVDSMIVGRFIGKDMLAAVGTAGPVMSIFILGTSGISMGASVLMSRFFGAGEEELLRKEVATVSVFGTWFSLILTGAGILGARPLLCSLQVPEEILGSAVIYLRLIFLGMPFTYFYNTFSSALKSVGDSVTPLIFLVAASVLNGVSDLILIGGLHFGIVCSALTTVAAQALSAALCIRYIWKRVPLLRPGAKEFRMDGALLKKTLGYGGVTALQQACQPVGNLLIQGAVNAMGVDVMAAFNAAARIDDYALVPERNISNAMSTFTAQNNGAGNTKRIREGLRTGLLLELAYGFGISLVVYAAKEVLIGLFVDREAADVLGEGGRYLGLMAFFYFLPGLTNGIQGYFRGMGMMKMTLAGTALQTGFRVLFVYLLSGRMGIRSFPVSCCIGWCAMLLLDGVCYYRLNYGRNRSAPA